MDKQNIPLRIANNNFDYSKVVSFIGKILFINAFLLKVPFLLMTLGIIIISYLCENIKKDHKTKLLHLKKA